MSQNQQSVEVDWYRVHGKYPAERIRTDGHGFPYVTGDSAWNLKNPTKPEWVEDSMPKLPIPRKGDQQ